LFLIPIYRFKNKVWEGEGREAFPYPDYGSSSNVAVRPFSHPSRGMEKRGYDEMLIRSRIEKGLKY